NGTKLNEKLIHGRSRLHQNDHIEICGIILVFRDPAGSPSTAEMEVPEGLAEEEEESSDSSTVEGRVKNGALHLESQSSERLRTLLRISGELSRSLDVSQLVQLIASRLFDLFKHADRALVLLEDPGTGHLVPRAVKTRMPTDRADPRYLR